MMAGGRSRRVETRDCIVDVSHTRDALHAHVSLDDMDVRPGDRVLVFDAPTEVSYGNRIVVRRRATIERASLLRRIWTRTVSYLALRELCEVGFEPRRKS